MSAQIILLADHRLADAPADPLDAQADALRSGLAAITESGATADPYGLVAAVRALAASMEQMKGQSAKMREAYQSLADGARTIVADTDQIASAAEKLDNVSASLVCI